ncbi:MAG: hypothetical protein WCO25_06045 [Candidatus Uhrbacteria bacterium]
MDLRSIFLIVCNERACEIVELDDQEATHARLQLMTTILENGSVVVRPLGHEPLTMSVGDIATIRTRDHAFQLCLLGSRRQAETEIKLIRPDGPPLKGEAFVVVEDIGQEYHRADVLHLRYGGSASDCRIHGMTFRRRDSALLVQLETNGHNLHIFRRFDESFETPAPHPHRAYRVTTKRTLAEADLYAACPVIPPE